MAVQIPDPGTGNGQTGDNEYVFRKKVKDNFSDQTNAASRVVGPAAGNVMEVGAFGLGVFNKPWLTNFKEAKKNEFFSGSRDTDVGEYVLSAGLSLAYGNDLSTQLITTIRTNPSLMLRSCVSGAWGPLLTVLHTANTSVDGNGFIKAASPIVKVYSDKVELNHEAETQNILFKKNSIGDYTITTVSGLSTNGWYLELPKDLNGNPKVAVTLSEADGVISLKSYKRIFSMETFTFVPDLNEPLDIPDGRWIDLRLNEIPVEMPEMPTEV